MLFGFIEQQQAVQAAPSGLEQQQFTWEGSWADALGNSLGLATQLVLNPGFGGPAVNYLMQEVIPEGFVAAATAAAADAAAGDPSAADVGSSTVSRASGVDVVQAAGQLQVQRQLLALTFWQRYAGLEERYQAWKQTRSSAVLSARVEPGTLGSLEDAVQLLQEMLILAGADALRLPAPQWLAERVSNMAEGEEGAGAAAAVAEGEWLCMPQYDAPVNPLMLAAYAGVWPGDWLAEVGGDMVPPQIVLCCMSRRRMHAQQNHVQPPSSGEKVEHARSPPCEHFCLGKEQVLVHAQDCIAGWD